MRKKKSRGKLKMTKQERREGVGGKRKRKKEWDHITRKEITAIRLNRRLKIDRPATAALPLCCVVGIEIFAGAAGAGVAGGDDFIDCNTAGGDAGVGAGAGVGTLIGTGTEGLGAGMGWRDPGAAWDFDFTELFVEIQLNVTLWMKWHVPFVRAHVIETTTPGLAPILAKPSPTPLHTWLWHGVVAPGNWLLLASLICIYALSIPFNAATSINVSAGFWPAGQEVGLVNVWVAPALRDSLPLSKSP
jgi:hypothetical protein